jgi:transcriptional regulator with XRE-family HTH domain
MPFEPPTETPGERMRRQRKRLNLSVREVAEISGLNKETVSAAENDAGEGKTRDSTWQKLAAALEAPVEWLRDGKTL